MQVVLEMLVAKRHLLSKHPKLTSQSAWAEQLSLHCLTAVPPMPLSGVGVGEGLTLGVGVGEGLALGVGVGVGVGVGDGVGVGEAVVTW